MMQPVVIYHDRCRDGFAAAWVANRYLRKQGYKPEFIAANHGDAPPGHLMGRNVFLLDFAYPRHVMMALVMETNLVVLDHHKTAQADLLNLGPGSDRVKFDMDRSGAGMTWDFFYGSQPRPWLIDYVEDRDLWRYKLSNSREVNAWIGQLAFDFDVWDATFDQFETANHPHIVDGGVAIIQKIEQYCRETSKNALAVKFDGYTVPMVNAPQVDISELLRYLLIEGPVFKPAFALGWSQWGDGKFHYSLRSDGDMDVSVLAKKYGGGGHKNAAGFESDVMLRLR